MLGQKEWEQGALLDERIHKESQDSFPGTSFMAKDYPALPNATGDTDLFSSNPPVMPKEDRTVNDQVGRRLCAFVPIPTEKEGLKSIGDAPLGDKPPYNMKQFFSCRHQTASDCLRQLMHQMFVERH